MWKRGYQSWQRRGEGGGTYVSFLPYHSQEESRDGLDAAKRKREKEFKDHARTDEVTKKREKRGNYVGRVNLSSRLKMLNTKEEGESKKTPREVKS